MHDQPLEWTIAKAAALGGGNLCADGHDWRFSGGKPCPRGNDDGSQEVMQCARCGDYDYGSEDANCRRCDWPDDLASCI